MCMHAAICVRACMFNFMMSGLLGNSSQLQMSERNLMTITHAPMHFNIHIYAPDAVHSMGGFGGGGQGGWPGPLFWVLEEVGWWLTPPQFACISHQK